MNWLLGLTSFVIAALALIGMPEWRLPILLGVLVVSAIGVIWGWDALVARVRQR